MDAGQTRPRNGAETRGSKKRWTGRLETLGMRDDRPLGCPDAAVFMAGIPLPLSELTIRGDPLLSNSVPWKEELLRTADRLEKKITQRRWTERSAFLVEKDVMVGAYAIRKLLEAPAKLSDSVKELRLPVLSHPLVAPAPPDWWDAIEWWDLYDMDSPEKKNVPLQYFCNLLIHSFVFAFHATPKDDGLEGVFVNSEYESKKALIFIATGTFVELFRTVGNDDVLRLEMQRDEQGRMHVIQAHNTLSTEDERQRPTR